MQWGEVMLGNIDVALLIELAIAKGFVWNGERVGAEGSVFCQSWKSEWGTEVAKGDRVRRSEVEWAVFHRGGKSEERSGERAKWLNGREVEVEDEE